MPTPAKDSCTSHGPDEQSSTTKARPSSQPHPKGEGRRMSGFTRLPTYRSTPTFQAQLRRMRPEQRKAPREAAAPARRPGRLGSSVTVLAKGAAWRFEGRSRMRGTNA